MNPQPPSLIRLSGRFLGNLLLAVATLATLAGPASAARELLFGDGVLWKVERPGTPPSHLFGTIHVTNSRVLDLPEPVRNAFESARRTAFEINFNNGQQNQMRRAVLLGDGRRLEDILGPQLFRDTARTARKYGLSAPHLQRLKPWSLMTFLSFPEARRQGKAIHGLETIAEQIDVFDGLPEADQVAFVRNMVSLNSEIDSWFSRLIAAYLERDLTAIRDMAVAQTAEVDDGVVDAFQARLLDERNKRMARRLIARLQEGELFAAVGALHLPGEQGILRLLELQGYHITRVY
jgi:uncharacterized protein YbaP (TraB family)